MLSNHFKFGRTSRRYEKLTIDISYETICDHPAVLQSNNAFNTKSKEEGGVVVERGEGEGEGGGRVINNNEWLLMLSHHLLETLSKYLLQCSSVFIFG